MVRSGAVALLAFGFGYAGSACAVPITSSFEFHGSGRANANNNDVTSATSITDSGFGVSLIFSDNTGLIFSDNTGLSSFPAISLTSPTPVTLGASFVEQYDTAVGHFLANLTVDKTTVGPSSLNITASGTITETVVLTGAQLDPAGVSYVAAYTQVGGFGSEVNALYMSTTEALPPSTSAPEPASIALPGIALAGLVALRRQDRNAGA